MHIEKINRMRSSQMIVICIIIYCLRFCEGQRSELNSTEMFEDKAVMSCPKDSLDENQLNDDLFSLMTFKEFNETSLKNKATTVTELFVKMLVQVKGISVEKALAIVEVYPSPALLLKAYLENEDVKPEKLLEQIQFGKYKKKIGPALSKIVSDLFTLERL